MTLWRLENSCPAWRERKGSEAIRQFIWDRMTPTARDANSTRELSKLSKEEQEEARKPNAGKHDANAGGWARTKEGEIEKEVSAPAKVQEKGATKPASSTRKNKTPQSDFYLDHNMDKELQHPSFALEEGSQNKRYKFREPNPSGGYALQNSYPGALPGDVSLHHFPHSDLANGDCGLSSSFSSIPDTMPIRAARDQSLTFSENPNSLPSWNRQNPSVWADRVMKTRQVLMRAIPNDQHLVSVAQRHGTHLTPDIEDNLEDHDSQPLNQSASYPWPPLRQPIFPLLSSTHAANSESARQPPGMDGLFEDGSSLNTNYDFESLDCSFHQQTRPFGDMESYAEEASFSTSGGINALANEGTPMEMQPPREVDYRSVPPRNEEEMEYIQSALSLTKYNYFLRIGSDCAPTTRHQNYFDQVDEVLEDFALHWVNPSWLPDLATSREPWRNGFHNWVPPTGGDEAFLNAQFDQYGGANLGGG